MIHLVDHQEQRLAGLAQQLGHFLVILGQAGTGIGEKADDIRRIHGNFRLPTHLLEQHILAARIDTTGINQGELSAQPFHIGIHPVPGNAGGILHDADALPGDLIKESGFAHVGAAHNGHQRS